MRRWNGAQQVSQGLPCPNQILLCTGCRHSLAARLAIGGSCSQKAKGAAGGPPAPRHQSQMTGPPASEATPLQTRQWVNAVLNVFHGVRRRHGSMPRCAAGSKMDEQPLQAQRLLSECRHAAAALLAPPSTCCPARAAHLTAAPSHTAAPAALTASSAALGCAGCPAHKKGWQAWGG